MTNRRGLHGGLVFLVACVKQTLDYTTLQDLDIEQGTEKSLLGSNDKFIADTLQGDTTLMYTIKDVDGDATIFDVVVETQYAEKVTITVYDKDASDVRTITVCGFISAYSIDSQILIIIIYFMKLGYIYVLS